jgi:hypothetical protein
LPPGTRRTADDKGKGSCADQASVAPCIARSNAGVTLGRSHELSEVIDAEACEGGCRFFAEAKNAETTVFRIEYDADTTDREDVIPAIVQAA